MPQPPRSLELGVSQAELWTLHHVLLDRIEAEWIAEKPGTVDPPSIEVFRAFETLDHGGRCFSIAELEAMQSVLAIYYHGERWETDHPRIEEFLHEISALLDHHRLPSHPPDARALQSTE